MDRRIQLPSLRALKQFREDEDGGALILSLFLFMTMIVLGGLAVDIAYYERTRAHLQSNLDGAVLAAASLTQELDPEAVIDSYMLAAGIEGLDFHVEFSDDRIGNALVGRTVTASFQGSINSIFMKLLGYDELGLSVVSEATESVEDIEISLVLDVSGSMSESSGHMTKIQRLQLAASDFVEDVLSEAEEGRVSISIIPYSTKVNAGAALLSGYNVTSEHTYSNCVDFSAADYRTTTLDPTRQLQRTGHFQALNWSTNRDSGRTRGIWTCRTDSGFEITPLSSSIPDLQARIAALTPEGNTSIDTGAKWGVALLDPSAQEPVSDLIGMGRVNAAFRDRPHAYNEEGSMKILVIMTDGINTTEHRLNSTYVSGPSDVWRMRRSTTGAHYYSVDAPETSSANDGNSPSNERYYYAIGPNGDDYWHNTTMRANSTYMAGVSNASSYNEVNLTWPQVWAEMSPAWYAVNLWGVRWNSSSNRTSQANSKYSDIFSGVGAAEKDNRLEAICDAAQQAGIIIFSIGFEVPEGGSSKRLLKDCASDETRYFDVESEELSAAFEMIASSINMLRLTK